MNFQRSTKDVEISDDGYKHVHHKLRIRLDELYNGSQRKLLVHRKCQKCNKLTTLQCYHWNDEAKWQEVNITVPMGFLPHTKLEYIFEGDGYEPIFLTVHMIEVEHEVFKRDGHNLIMEMEVYLVDAIIGFINLVKTLDNRTLLLRKSNPTREKDKLVVKKEGLPYYSGGSYQCGNLIIFCRIKFPTAEFLTDDKIRHLKRLFPLSSPTPELANAEERQLVSMSKEEEMEARKKFKHNRKEAEYYKFFPL